MELVDEIKELKATILCLKEKNSVLKSRKQKSKATISCMKEEISLLKSRKKNHL